jgi:hypothetical protein
MTIKRFDEFCPADRYLYDFRVCTYEKGWAQIDTRQDASYYGTWTNPERREIFSYCEGDTTLVQCDTDDEYRQAVQELAHWNKQPGYWLGIDPGFQPEMKQRFERLGLADFLH